MKNREISVDGGNICPTISSQKRSISLKCRKPPQNYMIAFCSRMNNAVSYTEYDSTTIFQTCKKAQYFNITCKGV